MTGLATAIVLVSFVAWVYLLIGHGRFWRAEERLPGETSAVEAWPAVVAVVPARNEAALIGGAVESLLAQDYAGDFRIVVVDDDSNDGTEAAARAAAERAGQGGRLAVVAAGSRPPEWAGKPWAMAEGVRLAEETSFGARYLWFTDADIVHGGSTLRRLVAKAEGERRDLVSLMVRLDCRSAWDRLLIPAFVFYFQMLYPFAWVNDPARREAGAAGGSMLVRASALARIGGIAAIRSALIDDCALARAIKQGGTIWLGLSEDDRSLRPYDGLGGIWSMVARTAFDQLRYSFPLLAGAMLGLVVTFVAPPVIAVAAAAQGEATLAAYAAATWAMMGFAWGPTLRLYGRPAWFGVLLPVAALLYTAMTIDSAWRHRRGKGGAWKGRAHGGIAHGR